MRQRLVPIAVAAATTLVALDDARLAHAQTGIAAPKAPAAGERAPNVKRDSAQVPQSWDEFRGLTRTELAPYEALLPEGRSAALVKLSRELFAHPGFAVIGALLKKRQDWVTANKMDEPAAEDSPPLMSYEVEGDPLLLVGTGKSASGPVTPPPRLNLGAFDVRQPAPEPREPREPRDENAEEGAGDAASDDLWMYDKPEELCGGSLGRGLDEGGEMLSSIEHLYGRQPLPSQYWMLVTAVESSPDPIIAGRDVAAPPPVAPAAGEEDADPADEQSASPEDDGADLDTKSAGRMLAQMKPLPSQIPDVKAACAKAGGTFIQADGKRRPSGRQYLLGCELPNGRATGFSAAMTYGDHPYDVALAVAIDDGQSGVGVELRITETGMELRALAGEKPEGPRVLWDMDGHAVALDFRDTADASEKAYEGRDYPVWEWHVDGTVKLHGRRRGGVPVGDERSWYDSGALAGEVNFAEKGRIARYREWFASGVASEDSHFEAGVLDGERRWWHPNGKAAGVATYEEGRHTGVVALWYPNGRLGALTHHQRGRLHGKATWWYEDGIELYTGDWMDGSEAGKHRLYTPQGTLANERSYLTDGSGEPDGTWTSFDATGKPIREVNFAKGKKAGPARFNWPTGAPFAEATFKDDRLDGDVKTTYADGTQAALCSFSEGSLTTFTRFRPDGTVHAEGKVADKEAGTGEWRMLRADGSTELECTLAAFAVDECKAYGPGGEPQSLPTEAQLAKAALKPMTDDGFEESGEGTATGSATATDSDGGDDDDEEAVASKDVRPEKRGAPPPWQPSVCGGYQRQVNVEGLLPGGSGEVVYRYTTKGDCPDANVATYMTCYAKRLPSGAFEAPRCFTERFDAEDDLQEIIEEMD